MATHIHRLLAALVATAALTYPGASACAQDDADPPATPPEAADTETDAEAPPPPPPPPPPPGIALPADGPVYVVDRLTLRYLRENPLHPPVEDAMMLPVTLGQTETGYVAPRDETPTVTMTLTELSERPVEPYHASAIQRILETLRDHYVALDLLGVYAAPDPREISEIGQDLRPRGQTALTIIITTGVITELRTAGSGDRVGEKGDIPADERINSPLHGRIIARSPVRPFQEGDDEATRADLLKKSDLDRYLFHLGRHPGRRVDASVAAAAETGGIALDYQVAENRPLVLYAQVSNTGTRSTDYWRQRFGLLHTQLTNRDDIFSLDYSTAAFDEVHSVTAAYEAPFRNDRIRWHVQTNWNQFDAEEIGQFNDEFDGESWSIFGEVAANIYQNRELFLDVVGGMRFAHIEVDNPFIPEGEEDFLTPYIGLRLERQTEWFNTAGAISLEWQGDFTGIDDDELERLGRTNPDDEWVLFRWAFFHSVFLEPLLDREGWEDPSTPESSRLAHELYFSFRGQWAINDDRVIAQEEGVVGGLYSVRGYPESVVAGDTTIIGTIEYRYHLPRSFAIEPEPGELFGETFRTGPQHVYGVPDWDLILKGFFDIGHVMNSDELFFEQDDTLLGAGIGMELLFRRNLNVRLDWGFTLDDLDAGNVNSGSNRLHVVATILF
jgi:hypothetical protein